MLIRSYVQWKILIRSSMSADQTVVLITDTNLRRCSLKDCWFSAVSIQYRVVVAVIIDDLMRSVVNSVNTSAHKYEEYFSTLCTYMKAQSIYAGVTKRKDAVSARVQKLRTHKQALRTTIARDEELAAAFSIRRAAAFEKNVTRFFDEDKVPKDNRLYYYEIDGGKTEIPLNTAGDMIWAPYKFIAGLKIEREDLYEDVKGEES